MKKITSILTVLCTCISACALLASCNNSSIEHTHNYKTEWAQDEKTHWHECEGENCAEISDESEHDWDEGKITTEATAEKDGERTYTCTVCNATKTESVTFEGHVHSLKSEWSSDAENHWHECDGDDCTEIFDKTAHTWDEGKISADSSKIKIFTCTACGATKEEALKLDAISKEEWEALSDPALYQNFTYVTTQIDQYFKSVTLIKIANKSAFMESKNHDLETDKVLNSNSRVMELTDEMLASITPFLPNYDIISYDAEKDLYYTTEAFTIPSGSVTFEYTKVEIMLKDGKIWKINMELWYTDTIDGKIDVTISAEYSDYGTTVIPETNT